MASIFPIIEEFQQIPNLHEAYAKKAIELMVKRILEEEEIEIGTIADESSLVSFDSDDFENVRIELHCDKREFMLLISDYSEDSRTSEFRYWIPSDSEIYELIPEGLKKKMTDAALDYDPTVFRPGEATVL